MQKEIDRGGRDRAGENAPGLAGRARSNGRAPGIARDRGNERGENERIDEPDLRNEELGQVVGRKSMRRRAAELLGEGRPAVLGVPGDERARRSPSATARPGKQRRRDEPAAQRRRRGESEDHAGGEKGGGELRLQREAKRQAQRDQPARFARAPELDQGASPSVQNTTSGASGVTNTAPMATSGMAIHISAASAAFPPNRTGARR